MKLIFYSLMILSLTNFNSKRINNPTENSKKGKKILFVCSNVAFVNEKPNGTFLSELAIPFIIFQEQGYQIDITSPKGKAIPIYYKFDTTEIIKRALNSTYYQDKILNSLTPEQVNPKDYIAVILPGGYGQFWDIHTNKNINNLISQIYENNGFIGALGHGTSSLANPKLSSEEYLINGKTITCFPTWFEKEIMTEANYGTLLPFDMEVKLKARGAKLKSVDKETFSNSQIIDTENRIVTASNANGGEFIATTIIKLITERK